MKIIDRYLIGKFLGTLVFMMAVILVISIVIDVAEKIDDFIERKPPIGPLIFSYYKNFAIFYGNLLLPICIFLAVIYFTSRLTNQTELVPLMSSGVSYYRILAPYMITAVIVAGFSFYLNAYMVPVATRDRVQFEYDHLKAQRIMRDVNIYKIVGRDEDKKTMLMLYLYNFNQIKQEGYNVTLTSTRRDSVTDIREKIFAGKIVWQKRTKTWRMENVRIHRFNGVKETMTFRPFIDTTLLITPEDIFIKDMKAESMPLNELTQSIELETIRGSGLEKELIKEKYERIAYPFAAIILTAIGFSVSTTKRRGGTPLQIGIGLIISFAYVVLLVAGQAIIGDKLPMWISVWLPNIVFSGVAVFMLVKARK